MFGFPEDCPGVGVFFANPITVRLPINSRAADEYDGLGAYRLEPLSNVFRAMAKNLFVRFLAAARGGGGDDGPVVLAVEFFEFALLSDVEVEGVDAEFGQTGVVFSAAADAGDVVAKRGQPLAKRFADVAATDDQSAHGGHCIAWPSGGATYFGLCRVRARP